MNTGSDIAPPNRAKTLLRSALLLLIVGSLLYLAVNEVLGRKHAASVSSAPTSAGNSSTPSLVVYYFSQGKECTTCENIPAYTREVLDTYFAKDLASGKIAYRSIDVDDPANEHFVSEYSLYTKSVVLVRQVDGKQRSWKKLDAVWDHVYDRPAFLKYVRDQIQAALEETP